MREILYIQAGNLSNHVSTHFWNAQETYFTYDTEEDSDRISGSAGVNSGSEPLLSHDVSFREGVGAGGERTYCPRVLIFDRKENFGTLSSQYDADPVTSDEASLLWNGKTLTSERGRIPTHEYQEYLEEEALFSSEPDPQPNQNSSEQPQPDHTPHTLIQHPPRFWSDFNRVFYTPKSLHQFSDGLTSLSGNGGSDDVWGCGMGAFERYDLDMGLMEGSVRSFVEECDRMQGLQLVNDTSFFGSFTYRFLQQFKDEHESKISSLVFSLAPSPLDREAVVDFDFTDSHKTMAVLNDALCIRHLNEEASLNCFLQPPSSWKSGVWDTELNLDLSSLYQTSGILSAHIESATIPLRLRGPGTDMSSFASYLTYGGTMRFCQLSGQMPAVLSEKEGADVERYIYDFSCERGGRDEQKNQTVLYSRWNVFRGLHGTTAPAYESWANGLALRDSPVTRTMSYQMPSSFPPIFKTLPALLPTTPSQPQKLRTIPLVSSLGASSTSSNVFMTYARFTEACWKKRKGLEVVGGDVDELREVRDEIWAMCDLYRGDLNGEGEEDGGQEGLGEDEEFA